MNNLFEFKDNSINRSSSVNDILSTQRIKKFLQGLQKQVTHLAEGAYKAFSKEIEDSKQKNSIDLSEKFTHLKETINDELTFLPTKEKLDYLTLFETIKLLTASKAKYFLETPFTDEGKLKIFDKILIFFSTLFNQSEITKNLYPKNDTQRLENFEALQSNIQKKELGRKTNAEKVEFFNEILNLFSELFRNIYSKLQTINDKIEFYHSEINESEETIKQVFNEFLCRTQKIAPGPVILNELDISFEKDKLILKKYDSLKHIWSQSLLAYHALISQFTLTVITIYSETLQNSKNYLNTLKTDFDNISVLKLSEGYIEKFKEKGKYSEKRKTENGEETVYYKRDLKDKFDLIDLYEDTFQYFDNRQKIIENLNDSMREFFPKVKTILDKTSWAIRSLKQYAESKEEIKQEQKNISNDEIQGLCDLQNEIVKKWNILFLGLSKINSQIENLKNFRQSYKESAICYLKGENIQGGFRHARKTVSDQEVHRSEFFIKLNEFEEFEKLYNKIKSDAIEEKSENKNSLKSSVLFPEKLEDSLQNQTINSEIKDIIGLVWISDEEKSEITKPFYEQETDLLDELTKYKENVNKTNEILSTIYRLVNDEINTEKKALHESSTTVLEYKDKFTSIYPYENYYVQKGQELFGNLTSGALRLAGYGIPEKKPFIPIQSSLNKK